MGTFLFGRVIIALLLLIAISAGVGLYLVAEKNALPTTPPTTTTPTTPPTTTMPTTPPTTTTPTTTTPTTTSPPPATTAPPEVKEGLAILSHSSYVDSFGYFHLVGEVENMGTQNTELNKVTVTFFDDEGNVVVTASNYSYLDILIPGQKCPFEIIMPLTPMEMNYKLEIAYQVTKSEPNSNFLISSIEVEVNDQGQYLLTGMIKNIGDKTASVVAIIGSFYDDSSQVVATGFTFANEMPLDVEASSLFIMVVDQEVCLLVDTYSLQAEGD